MLIPPAPMLGKGRRFPLLRQLDKMDCGATCLMMICRFYGRNLSLQRLRELCDKGNRGVTLLGISRAAEELGLRTLPIRLGVEELVAEAPLPCILHWQGSHFVVAYKAQKGRIHIADPDTGRLTLSLDQFRDFWAAQNGLGVALLVDPTESFLRQEDDAPSSTHGLVRLLAHLLRYKRLLVQLGIGALVGSLLNLIAPFLTQALVDHGIGNRDIGIVHAIVFAQLLLFLSRTAADFVRGWILVHIGTRVNVAVLSEFLMKLMRLPLSYFDRRNLGDVLQRVGDHTKIEEFLTSHSVAVAFSMVNLIIFSIVMALYSRTIFLAFFIGSLLSIAWVALFLNRRRLLDRLQFSRMSESQSAIVQVVQGMPEIKLNQCASRRRWEWERIQGRLFRVRLRALAVEQYQQAGSMFLNEGKNILITLLAAQQVIAGELTLGMMMAVVYILGQMNAPIELLLGFMGRAQDAKLSMERLSEVQDMEEERASVSRAGGALSLASSLEEEARQKSTEGDTFSPGAEDPLTLARDLVPGDIRLRGVSFKYGRHDSRYTLENLDLTLGFQRTTAIVGPSGSGKTTLMKLLLKFYGVHAGRIEIGGRDLATVCPDAWRERCGVVMQDGYIFSDTVAENIAMHNGSVNFERLTHAARSAGVHEEIEALPQGYGTRIGADGLGLSGGQTQRILIARAIYKNPEYLFLDEATSALDAGNERRIHQNLHSIFEGKTVLVIAHRLSTVKRADWILVLKQGKLVEQGTHDSLAESRGHYFNLVKDQLELG